MERTPSPARIAQLLGPDERLVAVHHGAWLERREPSPGSRLMPGLAGELHVTSRRLVFVGRLTLSFALDSIADAVISGERLLLVLRDGYGVALQVTQPDLLWVEITAARSWAQAAQPSADPSPPSAAAR